MKSRKFKTLGVFLLSALFLYKLSSYKFQKCNSNSILLIFSTSTQVRMCSCKKFHSYIALLS